MRNVFSIAVILGCFATVAQADKVTIKFNPKGQPASTVKVDLPDGTLVAMADSFAAAYSKGGDVDQWQHLRACLYKYIFAVHESQQVESAKRTADETTRAALDAIRKAAVAVEP